MKNKITTLAGLLLLVVFTYSVTVMGKSSVPDISKFNEKIYIAMNGNQTYKGDLNKYAKKYNMRSEKDYIGLSSDDLNKLLGTPAYDVKYREKTTAESVLEKEVWVYIDNKDNSKALYLLFNEGKVIDYVISGFDKLDDARIVAIFDDLFPEE